MAATREQIWNQLLATLTTALVPGLVTTISRRLTPAMSQLSDALLPAIFILETDEERPPRAASPGMPRKLVLKGELWIYTFQPDSAAPSTTQLNDILDAVDATLLPVLGLARPMPALGGLVTAVDVGGAVKITEGLEQGSTLGIVPLDILATV